ANCGACGNVCGVADGTAACSNGVCTVAACNSGYGNCDGNAGNGCETNLNTDLNNCGACGTVCTPPANATAVCSTGSCDFLCNSGLAKCNGACLDTSADINNCGACDHTCAAG